VCGGGEAEVLGLILGGGAWPRFKILTRRDLSVTLKMGSKISKSQKDGTKKTFCGVFIFQTIQS
jgi:hypothetical protein